jgi:16S rRNA (cytosine967-C5)-methyltransferase
MSSSPPASSLQTNKRHKTKPASSARIVVLMAAESVIDQGYALQDSLAASKAWQQLDSRDRRFARRLAAIFLRHRGDALHVLGRYLTKPLNRRDKKAEAILLLATAELIWADGDSHAAVDQGVRLMRGGGFAHLTGLANAILRKIAADAEAIKAEPATPFRNAPPWFRQMLIADWGDRAEDIMASLLMPPSLDLRIKDTKIAKQWAHRLGGVLLHHGSVRLADGMVSALEGYDEGAWWIQDAAASLPAMLIETAFPDGLKGKSVIDLCAAPGGKTAQLCAAGAEVIALDRSAARLKILNQNMTRLAMTPKIAAADGMTWTPDRPVDAVLIDAPCSATGTIRRKPDILTHQNPPDLARLNQIQRGLLEAATDWLKPGGVLVYATCSVLKSEGEAIVANPPQGLIEYPAETDIFPQFTINKTAGSGLRIMPDSLQCADSGTDGVLGALPYTPQGNDGFFMARFVKS